jgi:two-component system cell cycle sensor histidine kinase/response regulator CckA
MVVLVVDDNETVLAVVAPILRRSGFRVLQAHNLAGARRIWLRLRARIDLVVTDIQMPDGTGLELSSEFAADRPQTPVLFMSGGYFPHDPLVRAHLGPRRAFLEKPFKFPALLERIAELMAPPARRAATAAGG